MSCGLPQILLPVRDLVAATRLYHLGAGFPIKRSDLAHVDLDAGGIDLRLVAAAPPVPPVTLRIQTARLDPSVRRFVEHGAESTGRGRLHSAGEAQVELLDPDGHHLVLWRRLRESELEAPIPLPITVPWDEGAQNLLGSLLGTVPEAFRDVARQGSVAEAELLAGHLPVESLHAVRGFIRATPRLMRGRLHRPLIEHGIEPQDFQRDFHC